MSEEAISFIARVILRFNEEELARLRELLEQGGWDEAGVGAVIPPDLPLREGGAEAPLEWPPEIDC